MITRTHNSIEAAFRNQQPRLWSPFATSQPSGSLRQDQVLSLSILNPCYSEPLGSGQDMDYPYDPAPPIAPASPLWEHCP